MAIKDTIRYLPLTSLAFLVLIIIIGIITVIFIFEEYKKENPQATTFGGIKIRDDTVNPIQQAFIDGVNEHYKNEMWSYVDVDGITSKEGIIKSCNLYRFNRTNPHSLEREVLDNLPKDDTTTTTEELLPTYVRAAEIERICLIDNCLGIDGTKYTKGQKERLYRTCNTLSNITKGKPESQGRYGLIYMGDNIGCLSHDKSNSNKPVQTDGDSGATKKYQQLSIRPCDADDQNQYFLVETFIKNDNGFGRTYEPNGNLATIKFVDPDDSTKYKGVSFFSTNTSKLNHGFPADGDKIVVGDENDITFFSLIPPISLKEGTSVNSSTTNNGVTTMDNSGHDSISNQSILANPEEFVFKTGADVTKRFVKEGITPLLMTTDGNDNAIFKAVPNNLTTHIDMNIYNVQTYQIERDIPNTLNGTSMQFFRWPDSHVIF